MIMQNYVGCDISKQWLDFFDETSGRLRHIDNQADAIAAYVAGLDPSQDFVVMEATGVHDRLLRHALAKAGVPFSRHNPTHTHHYAKSTRRRAKTDPLDARMLSDYGRRYNPEAEPAPCEQNEQLQSLAGHRDHLVDVRARLKKHLAEAFNEIVIADLEETIAYLGTRIKALVGLAPFDSKSGKLTRRSQIQGGRSRVRRALYMAALTAIRTCDRFKTFYTALAARSGAKKLAIIAVARKLLVVLNAIIRDKTAFA